MPDAPFDLDEEIARRLAAAIQPLSDRMDANLAELADMIRGLDIPALRNSVNAMGVTVEALQTWRQLTNTRLDEHADALATIDSQMEGIDALAESTAALTRRLDTLDDHVRGANGVDDQVGNLLDLIEDLTAKVAELAARIDGGDPPPPVDPPPPPPEPPTLRTFDGSALVAEVNPLVPSTYGHTRGEGQAWAAGNMFQRGSQSDHIATELPPDMLDSLPGYGLTMDDNGVVESWPMDDGTTVRYGPHVSVDGKVRMRFATQGDPIAFGYIPAANMHFDNGQVVPTGGWRVQTAEDQRDGHSDARTFDGLRSGLALLDHLLPIGGANAPAIIFGIELAGQRWYQTKAAIGGPFSLHAPGWKLTGPFGCSIKGGRLVFASKSSQQPDPLDFDTATNNTPGLMTDVHLGSIPAPTEGESIQLVCAVRPDRTGQNNLFEVWTGAGQGGLEHVLSSAVPYGYTFTDPSRNIQAYLIAQVYQWAEWATPTSRLVREEGLPIWNHDGRFGRVYSNEFGVITATTEAQADLDWPDAVELMGEHVAERMLAQSPA